VEDDHVDRPGVEERQRLKLTGTNSSIGLIVLIPYIHRGAIQRIVAGTKTQLLDLNVRFADLVVMAERLHPIPFRTRP
jgi:hypothetical protein